MTGDFSSFARLKEQSARDRIQFLKTDLALSFTFAAFAEAEHQTGNSQAASKALGDAQKGCSTVQRFLRDPKHAQHIPPEVEQLLRAELGRLVERIDELILLIRPAPPA